MSEINNHRRVNDILLGPLERPTLRWLAAHTPTWITPDACTIIGIMGAVGASVGYLLSTYDSNFLWLASLGFAVNWLGDSLDGTLARHRHIERPIFGFFVDHTTDAFSVSIIVLGLGLTHYVSFSIACLLLIAYLLMCVLVFVRTSAVGEFKISYSKLGPTEIRVIAIFLNTTMYFGGMRELFRWDLGALGPLALSPYDFIVIAIALLLFYFFFVTAAKETIRLAKENR
jgi:phosphatidylglycerophosphate synthase